MFIITVISTKGGVGKTTLAANLGGLLHDIGLRVLLVDADIQPSLSLYYQLSHEANEGLTQLVRTGVLTSDCISHCQLPPDSFSRDKAPRSDGGLLHLVRSDARDGRLQDWMAGRNPRDLQARLSYPLRQANVTQHYDVVIIDTQGAVGHLQDAAVMAADTLLVPVSPDTLSAREFLSGTQELIGRHKCIGDVNAKMPPMKAVLNRAENNSDSKLMASLVRDSFIELGGQITMMESSISAAVAYKKAATASVPVHWIDPVKASDAVHKLLWELIPSVSEMYASNHRSYIDLNNSSI